VVDGRTGLLVPPDDDAALAAALARVLDDGEARAAWGRAGPERVQEGFLPSQMVAAYVDVYRSACEEWGRR
jgi:glycosyltransferase involved in cell wall biosynthesis